MRCGVCSTTPNFRRLDAVFRRSLDAASEFLTARAATVLSFMEPILVSAVVGAGFMGNVCVGE